ncbi:hypothetical protein GQ54DRAFT_148235 [Martensiomyces pterosporus]|nr:hypothetical protein GQ54DRAFT_148235 [Martensiomyces pterosporus]
MAGKSEEQILRSRLVVEERPLKRCLRHFSAMCERSTKLTPEEAAKSCEGILQEVRWFRHTVQIAVQSQRRCEQEITAYDDQCTELEAQIDESRAEVKSLGDKLEESRNHKRHKIAYDEIAKEANRRPSREKLREEIDEINREIEQLQQEEAAHESLVESLRSQYTAVCSELGKLEEMSKSALNTQDLGIYLGDGDAMVESEGGKAGPGDQNNPSMGISPATPHGHGGGHDEFSASVADTPLLDGVEEDAGRRKSEGQLDDAAEDEDDGREEGEDGDDLGIADAQHTGAEHAADVDAAAESEEEGELLAEAD